MAESYSKPKVSVVLGVRNEYPVILGTMLSFIEELEYWGYPYEIIVVDNMSTDNTRHILRDKLRRWVRMKLLKVIEYDEKPANVTVRNIGAKAADGEVVFLADGHLSIKVGTLHMMIQGWLKRGGLWHSAIHIWGDTSDIRCYGYDLKLRERFWGNLSRGIPKEIRANPQPYRVPMASHCCLMAGREEYLDFGGYHENFRCYGGGEPYLDLKWWLFGSEVWLEPRGLVRHAFGVNPHWRKGGGRMSGKASDILKRYFGEKDEKGATRILRQLPPQMHDRIRALRAKDSPLDEAKKELSRGWPKETRNLVYNKAGEFTHWIAPDEEFLHYSRGYNWTNEQFQFNFMLSAYLIGGYEWLQQRYGVYYETRKGNPRYVSDLQELRKEVLRDGREDRKFIESRQKLTLDQLIEKKPWENYEDLDILPKEESKKPELVSDKAG